jgi:hypothetical protein
LDQNNGNEVCASGLGNLEENGLSQIEGLTVPKWAKDWRREGYFEGHEVFETRMWYAKPNEYGLNTPVSSKMWYVPHFKERYFVKEV